MLESRAGVPAWGPELLARHQLVGIIDTLPELYSAWEEWAAAVAESHTTYPVLLLFRSPEPWFSWLLALLAVLDGAAMHLALSPATASSNARLCLRMGFTALDRIGSMLGWDLDPDPLPEAPIELTYEEFEQAVAHARARSGFPVERTRRRGLAGFPRLAGQLRDRRLPPGRSAGGAPGALVRPPPPPRSRNRRAPTPPAPPAGHNCPGLRAVGLRLRLAARRSTPGAIGGRARPRRASGTAGLGATPQRDRPARSCDPPGMPVVPGSMLINPQPSPKPPRETCPWPVAPERDGDLTRPDGRRSTYEQSQEVACEVPVRIFVWRVSQ